MPNSTQHNLALRDPSRSSINIAVVSGLILTTLFVVLIHNSESWIHDHDYSTLVLIALSFVLLQILCTGIAFAHANRGWLRIFAAALTAWIFCVSIGLMLNT